MLIQSELKDWSKQNGFDRFETYIKAVEDLLSKLDFVDKFDWDQVTADVEWLIENVTEDALGQLQGIVYRLAELFAQTDGLRDFKDDEYDHYMKI